MSNKQITKAMSISSYPAPCFEGWQPEKQHRRAIRQLAEQGYIQLLDSKSRPLDLKAVINGSAHYDGWRVSAADAQVIEQHFEDEQRKVNEERLRREREREEQDRDNAEQRKRQAHERKARNGELRAAGLWTHPRYKTLKAAYADGWRTLKYYEHGVGEQIILKGHTLFRSAKQAQSKTWWNKAGFGVKAGEKPHATRAFVFSGGWVEYPVYRDDQVEPLHAKPVLPETNLVKSKTSRSTVSEN